MVPALEVLLSRRSVDIRHLTVLGPDGAQLRAMADAALRAPDHAGLVPFRFAVVHGVARERLAPLFEQAARDAGNEAGETLVGWIALGTPVKSPSRGGDKPRAQDILQDWR